jgi:hypothetical protein
MMRHAEQPRKNINKTLSPLPGRKSVHPMKSPVERAPFQATPIKLPSVSSTVSPLRLIKSLKPAISLPMLVIKRRFKNTKRLLRLVPVNDFFSSIQDNSPFIETVLERNWAKQTENFSQVVPVYENRYEEDELSSREEEVTPQNVKELICKLRSRRAFRA